MSRWATIAPVNLEWRGPSFDLTAPIDIGWGVHLIPLPAWLKQPNITRYMSWVQREQYIGLGKFALLVEYDAESLWDPDPLSNIGPLSKQRVAAEKLRRGNLALWLARPSWAGFSMVISAHEDHGDWVQGEMYPTDTIRPFDRDAANTLSRADFVLAKTLGDAASTLSTKASTWVALMLLWRALTEFWWEPAVAAAVLGRRGGRKSLVTMTKAERRIRAHDAAVARWAKVKAAELKKGAKG